MIILNKLERNIIIYCREYYSYGVRFKNIFSQKPAKQLDFMVLYLRKVIFLRRKAIFLRWNAIFPRRNVIFLRWKAIFLRRNVIFLRRNVVFLRWIATILLRKAVIHLRITFFLWSVCCQEFLLTAFIKITIPKTKKTPKVFYNS